MRGGGGGGVFRERQQQLYDHDFTTAIVTLRAGAPEKTIFFGRRSTRH